METQKAWVTNPLDFTVEDIEYFKNGSSIFVIARNPSRGLILLGGLGFAGMGEMWKAEDTPKYAYYRGYDQAEIVSDPIDKPDDFQRRFGLTH